MNPIENCRLCLKQDKEVLNIFDEINVLYKIRKYLFLDIREDENLSKFVCVSCLTKIDDFDNFCKKVEENQIKCRNNLISMNKDQMSEVSDDVIVENIVIEPVSNESEEVILECIKEELDLEITDVIQDESDKFCSADSINNGEGISPWESHKNRSYFNKFDNFINKSHSSNIKDTSYNSSGNIDIEINSEINSDTENNTRDSILQEEEILQSILESVSDISDPLKCDENDNNSQLDSIIVEPDIKRIKMEIFDPLKCDENDNSIPINSITVEPNIKLQQIKKKCPEKDNEKSTVQFQIKVFDIKQKEEIDLVQQISNFYKLECELCPGDSVNRTFSRLPLLLSHYYDVHRQKGYINCCGMKIHNFNIMVNHMYGHSRQIQFKCFSCPNLGPFGSRYAFNRHIKTHSNINGSVSCKQCVKSFSNNLRLQKHMLACHRNEMCRKCGRSFSSRADLNYHLITHNIVSLQCDICKNWFSNKNDIKTHRLIHSKDGHYEFCEECGRKFTEKQHLLKHVADFHTKHKCNKCDKTFSTKRSLNLHLPIHEIVAYQCDICNKWLKTKCSLKCHRLHHFSGAGIFRCDKCNFCTSKADKLTLHVQIHSNFSSMDFCLFCKKGYKSRSKFCNHQKKNYPIELADSIKLEK